MSNKKYLDYAGLKRVLAKLLPGARKIWHGTWDEWEALTPAEKAKYDQAELYGSFKYEQFVVDNAIANTENPVTSDAVAKAYKFDVPKGNVYFSTEVADAGSNWTYNRPVTVSNLPKGKYLIGMRIISDKVGIIDLAGASVGTVSSLGSVSASYNNDYHYNEEIVGIFTMPADGNVTFKLNMYRVGRQVLGQVCLVRIA